MIDPINTFLETFFQILLSPQEEFWKPTKSLLKEDEFHDLRTFVINYLVEDYNSRLAVKTGNIDLYKQPSKFPAVVIEHYNTKESLRWCWKWLVVRKWDEVKDLMVPEVVVNEQLAEVG